MSFLALQGFLQGCEFTQLISQPEGIRLTLKACKTFTVHVTADTEGLDPVAYLLGQKGGCDRCPARAKHHPSHSPIHSSSILLCAYSAPSRGRRPPVRPELQWVWGAEPRTSKFSGRGSSPIRVFPPAE